MEQGLARRDQRMIRVETLLHMPHHLAQIEQRIQGLEHCISEMSQRILTLEGISQMALNAMQDQNQNVLSNNQNALQKKPRK